MRLILQARNKKAVFDYKSYLKRPDIKATRQEILEDLSDTVRDAIILYESSRDMGIPAWSDSLLAQALAVYTTFGNYEGFVVKGGLNAVLTVAQWRTTIYGGLIPDPLMIKNMNTYIKQLEIVRDTKSSYPDWYKSFKDRYKLPNYLETR